MRYKLGQSIPLRRTLLFLTSLGRRASCGAFVPYLKKMLKSVFKCALERNDNR